MKKETGLKILGRLLLLFATVVWGSSFTVLKSTMDKVPYLYILAIRFLSSAALIGVVFIKRVKKMYRSSFLRGATVGVVLSLAYIVQTCGLQYTTASRNAFLTATYCVMTPFLVWLFFKTPPKSYDIAAAVICLAGIALVSFSGAKDEGGGNYLLGDGLTLVCAVFYALQIICLNNSEKHGDDAMQTVFTELLVTGFICAAGTLIFDLPKNPASFALNVEQILKIAYLSVVCTLLAQTALMYGQKFTPPSESALILSLEAVFGVLFGVIIGSEKLGVWLVIGFALIFVAMIVSETKFDPFGRMKNKLEGNNENGEEK